jgi:surface carbohydrate biosynthesis protein
MSKLKLFYLNIEKIFSKLLKISKSKILFSKVRKSEILVFGTPGYINILKDKKYNFIKFKDINFLHVWGESYNFYILMKCLFNLRFDHLYYCNQYISSCNPKIILSFLDNYKIFYLLKKNKFQKKILIQGSFRTGEYDNFKKDKKFHDNKVDYVFAHNKEIGKKYFNLLGSKFYSVGSFLSNNVSQKKCKKIYDLVYISTFRNYKSNKTINGNVTIKDYVQTEKEFVKKIQKFAYNNKKKLHILCTNKPFQQKEEIEFFDTVFENKKWNMIKRGSNTFKSTYEILNKSNIVLGIDSTVLYESFARGKKTIFFDIRPTNKYLKKMRHFAWPKKLKNNGPFWTNKSDYYSIDKLIKKVDEYDKKEWLKINKKFRNGLMSFDEKNKTFCLIMKKLLN